MSVSWISKARIKPSLVLSLFWSLSVWKRPYFSVGNMRPEWDDSIPFQSPVGLFQVSRWIKSKREKRRKKNRGESRDGDRGEAVKMETVRESRVKETKTCLSSLCSCFPRSCVFISMVRGHVSGQGDLNSVARGHLQPLGHLGISSTQQRTTGLFSWHANETGTNVPSLLGLHVPKCLTLFLSAPPFLLLQNSLLHHPNSFPPSLLCSLNELSNSSSISQFNFTRPLSRV